MSVSSPLLPWVEHWQDEGISPFPSAFALRRVGCVPSTNRLLWQQLAQQAASGDLAQVVIAQSQSQGRGQWGRQWASAPGGLYLSSSLPPLPVPPGTLMVACAWGIAAALRQFGVPVRLKWPNDLVVGSQKLGGMLVETRLSGTTVRQAILGVGINWQNSPPAGGIAIAALERAHPQIRACFDQLVAAILSGIAIGCGRLQAQGMAAIPADYSLLMTHRGQFINCSYRGQAHRGQVEGIAPEGQLLVRLNRACSAAAEAKGGGHQSDLVHLDVGQVHLPYATAATICPPS